jgi:hypothetical protein
MSERFGVVRGLSSEDVCARYGLLSIGGSLPADTILRIPEHRDHRFRPKVITDSGIPITHSGDRDH